MKIYLANATRQHMDFQYRLRREDADKKETWIARRQPIPALTQVLLAGGADFAQVDADTIIKHHERYGMRKFDDSSKDFKGLLYSFEPMELKYITSALGVNDEVAQKRSDDMLANTTAAVAEHQREVAAAAGSTSGVRADIEVTDLPKGGGEPALSKGAEALTGDAAPKRSNK